MNEKSNPGRGNEEGGHRKRASLPNETSTNRSNDSEISNNDHPKRLRTASSQQSSPIKLFATTQDLEVRKNETDPSHWARSQCETLRELLGFDSSTCTTQKIVDWIVIGNYMIDFEFLIDQVPELVSIPRVVVFFGFAETSPASWKQAAAPDSLDLRMMDPSEPPGPSNPTTHRIPYGVHHSKFFLVGYRDGTLRVVVHTANLRHSDIFSKAQAAYRQDFPLKQPVSQNIRESPSPFEATLLDYLDTYKFQDARVWKPAEKPTFLRQVLRQYDFSSAQAVLVPSTPGYHKLDAKEQRGHLKIRQCIGQNLTTSSQSETSGEHRAIVCQFSSMGSLSEKYLREEFQKSFSSIRLSSAGSRETLCLKLVYPTVQEIRESVEGYRGGCSVPGPSKNVHKPFLRPLFCRWSLSAAPSSLKNPLHKGQNVPHIKTYFQLGRDENSFDYFVVSSHNLSKAAWGEIQNSSRYGERRLFIRHWELGVFLSPSLLRCSRLVAWSTESLTPGDLAIPLPYRFKPLSYDSSDRAWAVDELHSTPDRFGRHSCME